MAAATRTITKNVRVSEDGNSAILKFRGVFNMMVEVDPPTGTMTTIVKLAMRSRLQVGDDGNIRINSGSLSRVLTPIKGRPRTYQVVERGFHVNGQLLDSIAKHVMDGRFVSLYYQRVPR